VWVFAEVGCGVERCGGSLAWRLRVRLDLPYSMVRISSADCGRSARVVLNPQPLTNGVEESDIPVPSIPYPGPLYPLPASFRLIACSSPRIGSGSVY
jgi:hypothetical protein